MVRLQQDIVDYRAELKISRTHTPAVSTRYWDSVQTTVEASAPTPEVPAVEKLLQRLVTGTPEVPAVVMPEVPAVEKLLQRLVTGTVYRQPWKLRPRRRRCLQWKSCCNDL